MAPQFVILSLVAYVALLLVVSWIAGRHSGNGGFFTAGRRTPWPVAAVAMTSAAMSGVTFVSVPGSVAADSFTYLQMVAGFTVGHLVVAFALVPTFYRLGVVSLYEYLDIRFGVSAQRTGAWFFFISKMLGTALKLYLACVVMHLLLFDGAEVPFALTAAVMIVVVWLATCRGGVRSVVWTDVVKTLVVVSSLVVTIVCIARALGLSLCGTVDFVAASPMSQVLEFGDPSSERYFWKMFLSGVVLLVAMTGLDQDLMQRNLSCPSPRDAQKNILLSAITQIVVIVLFLVLGVLLYAYADSSGLPSTWRADTLFPAVATHGGLPLAVGVLFVMGLAASSFSSTGSAVTALTTSFVVDILRTPHSATPERLTRVRHAVHAAMAAAMLAVVVLFDVVADDSVINLVFKVAGYTYGPLLGMFLFGLATRRKVGARGFVAAALAAPLLTISVQLLVRAAWGCEIGFELLIYNTLFTLSGLWLGSTSAKE